MLNRLIHLRTTAIALMALLAASCIMENGPVTCEQTDGTTLSLHISVLGDAATRSGTPTTSDNYEDGSGLENYIDIDKLQLLFFTSTATKPEDDTFITAIEFNPNEVTPEDNSEYPQHWRLVKELADDNELLKYKNFRLVVLANWPGKLDESDLTTGKTTIKDICCGDGIANMYDLTVGITGFKKEEPIPMYGVKTCEGVTFRNMAMTNLGEIYILRAMAKIEVICDADGYELTSALIDKVNTKGYCAPEDIYENTWSGFYDDSFGVHVSSDWETNEDPISMTPVTLEDGSECFRIYIPEYLNSKDACPAIDVILRDEDKNTTTHYTIYVRDYTKDENVEDSYFDICRNYVYRYTITGFNSKLELKYTVCPWGEKTVNIPTFE